jgi:hypothetical protein
MTTYTNRTARNEARIIDDVLNPAEYMTGGCFAITLPPCPGSP